MVEAITNSAAGNVIYISFVEHALQGIYFSVELLRVVIGSAFVATNKQVPEVVVQIFTSTSRARKFQLLTCATPLGIVSVFHFSHRGGYVY